MRNNTGIALLLVAMLMILVAGCDKGPAVSGFLADTPPPGGASAPEGDAPPQHSIPVPEEEPPNYIVSDHVEGEMNYVQVQEESDLVPIPPSGFVQLDRDPIPQDFYVAMGGYNLSITNRGITVEKAAEGVSLWFGFDEALTRFYNAESEFTYGLYHYVADNAIWLVTVAREPAHWALLFRLDLSTQQLIWQHAYTGVDNTPIVATVKDNTIYTLTGKQYQDNECQLRDMDDLAVVGGWNTPFRKSNYVFAADHIKLEFGFDYDTYKSTEDQRSQYYRNNTFHEELFFDENGKLALRVTSSSGDEIIYAVEEVTEWPWNGIWASNPEHPEQGVVMELSGNNSQPLHATVVYPQNSDILSAKGGIADGQLLATEIIRRNDGGETREEQEEGVPVATVEIADRQRRIGYRHAVIFDGVTCSYTKDEALRDYLHTHSKGSPMPIDPGEPFWYTNLDKSHAPAALEAGDQILDFTIAQVERGGNRYADGYSEESFHIVFDGEIVVTGDLSIEYGHDDGVFFVPDTQSLGSIPSIAYDPFDALEVRYLVYFHRAIHI